MKTKFTKDELYEIEKLFDNNAGNHIHGLALIMERMAKAGLDTEELVRKIIKEGTSHLDMVRTVSAKAKKMRQ